MRVEKPILTPPWTWILWAVAGVSIIAAFVNLFSSWSQQDQSHNDLHVVSSGSKAVRIHGHLAADRVEPSATVECWFQAQNVGDRPVAELKMRWSAAGFEPAEFKAVKTLLQPGEMTEFRSVTELRASDTPQRFTATAEVDWCTDLGPDSETIVLGPITVRGESEPRIFAVSKMWVDLLKDLALPVILIVATSLFSIRQRNAEARGASWNLMLEKSHANAEKHYMPLSNAALRAALMQESANPADPKSFHPVTFEYLLFLKRYRLLWEDIGGFYLSTRSGEKIVVQCMNALEKEFQKWLERPVRAKAKDFVGKYMEFHTFTVNPLPEPEVQRVNATLVRWAAADRPGMDGAFAALRVLSEVLTYDINLNYRFWYDDPPEDLSEMTEERTRLRSSGSPALAKIATLYESYRLEKRPW